MSLQDEYKQYCDKFNSVWNYLQSCSKSVSDITNEICEARNYFNSYYKWYNVLNEVGVAFVTKDTCDYSKFEGKAFEELALFSDEGYFLMNERYILPVKDMLGNVIALIGWYPDNKRYITTPSRFFSKDCLFFGMDQLGKTGLGKDYVLVEGIFDSLSVRALGLNSVAQMGITTSRIKVPLYGLFGKLLAVPDNDKQGRKVVNNDEWKLPRNGSYLRWLGSLDISEGDDVEKLEIKDIDKLCSLYEDDDVRYVLNNSFKDNKRIIKLEL